MNVVLKQTQTMIASLKRQASKSREDVVTFPRCYVCNAPEVTTHYLCTLIDSGSIHLCRKCTRKKKWGFQMMWKKSVAVNKRAMDWVPPPKPKQQQLLHYLDGSNSNLHIMVCAAVVSFVSLILFSLLRPPVVVYRSKTDERYTQPYLQTQALIAWSLVAGAVFTILAMYM